MTALETPSLPPPVNEQPVLQQFPPATATTHGLYDTSNIPVLGQVVPSAQPQTLPPQATTGTTLHDVNPFAINLHAQLPNTVFRPTPIAPQTPRRPNLRFVPASALSTPGTIRRAFAAIDAEEDSDDNDPNLSPYRNPQAQEKTQHSNKGGRPAADDVWTFFRSDPRTKEQICLFCE